MVIIFSSPKALKQLLEKGEVYTLRTHKRKTRRKKDWVTDRRLGKKICDVEVELIAIIKQQSDLIPFVEKSGFEHLWDWVAEIRRLNPKDVAIQADIYAGYLYHVKI